MDITKLDINQLKVLAYDTIKILEQAQSQLTKINQQITTLENEQKTDIKSPK